MPSLLCSHGLIVLWIFSLHSLLTCSELWISEVSDVQYGRLGGHVTLQCRGRLSGAPVHWRLNGSVTPWENPLLPDGSLLLYHTNFSMEGNYSCHDDQGLLIHTTTLQLGYPPGLLSVSCRLPNHSLALCSWTESVDTHLPAQYQASYRDHDGNEKPCVMESVSGRRCTIRDPDMYHQYWISITQNNPLGSNNNSHWILFLDHVKPDPPEFLVVVGMEGYPMRLKASWRYPETWKDKPGYPLFFQLRYQPLGSNHWSILNSDSTSSVVMDALARHPHQLQVRARDSYLHWSEWSAVVLAWPWRDPNVVELMKPTEESFNGPNTFTICNNTESVRTEDDPEEDGGWGLVILLALFAGFIFVIVFMCIFILWMKQRRRDSETKQEVTSMLKMKSMTI